MASCETELYWSSFLEEIMTIADQILFVPFLFCIVLTTAFHFSLFFVVVSQGCLLSFDVVVHGSTVGK